MAEANPVWAGQGTRILPDGYARLPNGDRVLIERMMQDTDLDPYEASGQVRVMTTRTETLLIGREPERPVPPVPTLPYPNSFAAPLKIQHPENGMRTTLSRTLSIAGFMIPPSPSRSRCE